MDKYIILFDAVILKQFKKLGENKAIRKILTRMMDKIEENGPRAGKLIDSKLFIYERKNKNPPIRLYFKHVKDAQEIYLFEYEMKTSEKKQQKIIQKLKSKAQEMFKS